MQSKTCFLLSALALVPIIIFSLLTKVPADGPDCPVDDPDDDGRRVLVELKKTRIFDNTFDFLIPGRIKLPIFIDVSAVDATHERDPDPDGRVVVKMAVIDVGSLQSAGDFEIVFQHEIRQFFGYLFLD